MKPRTSLLTLLSMIAVLTAPSQTLKNNTVYRINNYGTSGRSMAIPSSGQNIVTSVTNADDTKQQWIVTTNDTGNAYYFRNVANGSYLTSSRQTSAAWTTQFADNPDNTKMLFTLTDKNGNSAIRATGDTNGYGYAHNATGNSVVCWEPNNLNTQWVFEEVPKTDSELKEILARFQSTADEISKASTYQQHLLALFNDYACTDLIDSENYADTEHYKALSPALQLMVDKIAGKDWSETKGNWNSKYAYKYRVQLYEPYSEGSAAAGMAGIQAYTNMNNPTGILADANELIYVMVNEDIPEGSTLYISGAPDGGMYNSVTSGTQLHKGLNIVLCNENNSHLFIYYTVNTVKNGKPTEYKVTEFPSLKIHIEGGRLNGFFNAIGDDLYAADKREDYEYTVARATHPMYDLIGRYVILHFFLNDTPNTVDDTQLQYGVRSSLDPTINTGANKIYDPARIIAKWDNLCFAERMLMGIQSDADILKDFNQGMYSSIVGDPHSVAGYTVNPGFQYSDYFNNRMMGITLQAKGLYMNATAWRTAYAPSTISAILTLVEEGMWGPAHEYGHMNQTPMRIAGTTEESNNVFSNVSMFFNEKTTSRSDFMSSQLKIFNQNKTFLEHSTWGTTRMFWQLWLYYHATKHNTKFYPRLYELLRKNPLKRDMTTYSGKLAPRYDMLHFAKMCCVAAGEDLTDFFTAWGFFVPLDNYHIDDYDVYDCILTPEDIAAVKQEIADMHLTPNRSIILIDDRPGSDRISYGEFPKEKGGDLGGLKDFSSDAAPSGNYNFTIDGNTVTVGGDGTGAVGFLIYDNEGNLIGFSNSYSFELTPEAIEKLLNGEAYVEVMGSDNSSVTATNTALDGTPAEKKQLLTDLIALCKELLSMEDDTESLVGYLFPASCTELKAAVGDAEDFLETVTDDMGSELTEAYKTLSEAYYALYNDVSARITIVPGSTYRLINNAYKNANNVNNKVLDASASAPKSTVIDVVDPVVPFSQQWIMEKAVDGSSNEYYIKNLDSGLYLNANMKYNVILPMGTVPQSFTLVTIENGLYGLAPNGSTGFGLHMQSGGNILHWTTTSSASQWVLKKVNEADYVAARQALLEKLNQAKELLAEAGICDGIEDYKMKFTDDLVSTNAEYKGPNTGDRLTTWQVIFDDNINTYFHSNYNGENSTDGLDHYIQLKAPEGDYFNNFIVRYTTRNNTSTGTNPTAVRLLVSADGSQWENVLEVTSGLKTGAAVSNALPRVSVEGRPAYLRFMVTKSGDQRGGHAYFAVSELSIVNRHELTATPSDKYPKVKAGHMTGVGSDILDGSGIYNNPEATFEDLQLALAALTASHNALLAAMQGIQPVESITFESADISLLLNESAQLEVSVGPDDATDKTFEISVEPEGIVDAAISETDAFKINVKPLAVGHATVTARTLDGSALSAKCRVEVLPVPLEGLEISVENNTIKVGDNPLIVTAVLSPVDATLPSLQWSVSDNNLAQIIPAEDGQSALLYPLAMGKVEVNVQMTDNADINAKTVIKVLPEIPVASIALSPAELTVPLNAGVISINAEVSPVDAFDKALKWESSNHEVAIVNENTGELTLTGEGSAIITASSTDGTEVSATCQLTVTEAVAEGIYIIPAEVSIEVGESVILAAGYEPADAETPVIEWSTVDTDIVHVESDGTVAGVKEGTATVVASANVNGSTLHAEAKVTVTPPVIKSLWLSATTLTMENGTTATLTANYAPNTTDAQLLWSIDDTSILDYSETDDPCTIMLHALDDGTTTVNLQSGNNPELLATCVVNIMEGNIKSIKLVVDSYVIDLSEGAKTVYVSFEPATLPVPNLVWTSSNESVATVTSIGGLGAEIMPWSVGKTTISVAHSDLPDVNDTAEFDVLDSTTAIAKLLGDDLESPVDVYSLNGTAVKIQATVAELHDLRPGFYIIHQGSRTHKILLK